MCVVSDGQADYLIKGKVFYRAVWSGEEWKIKEGQILRLTYEGQKVLRPGQNPAKMMTVEVDE